VLFIIEGTDGTGKTSLALDLQARLPGTEIVHLHDCVPGYADMAQYGMPVNSWQEDAYLLIHHRLLGGRAICDRGPLSGLVYSDVPAEVEEWMLGLMADAGRIRLIHLWAPFATVAQRDPEWAGRESEFMLHQAEFIRLTERCGELGIPTLEIDTSRQPTMGVAFNVCKALGVRY